MNEPNLETSDLAQANERPRDSVSPEIEKQGEKLFEKLERFRGHQALVISPSHRAAPLAKFLAQKLEGHSDILGVRTLTDPMDESIVVGAVSEWGSIFLNSVAQARGLSMDHLREQIMKKIEAMRIEKDTDENSSVSPEGRLVIVVDTESIAGDRLAAALYSMKTLIPKKVILALPKMSHRAFALLNNQCDEIIALEVTSNA
jgi:predicted phosphoribosyltransferase